MLSSPGSAAIGKGWSSTFRSRAIRGISTSEYPPMLLARRASSNDVPDARDENEHLRARHGVERAAQVLRTDPALVERALHDPRAEGIDRDALGDVALAHLERDPRL